jgi:hypothetical protein
VAHGAGQPVKEARLQWKLSPGELNGHFKVAQVEAGRVQSVAMLTFAAPASDTPALTRLDLTLVASDGSVLATNFLNLTILSQQQTLATPLWSPDSLLVEQLTRLGYHLAATADQADVIVAERIDESLMSYVRQGKNVLLLANQSDAIEPAYLGIRVVARQHTPWAGDWASSFAWLRREGPFASIPGGPLLDFSFDGLIPDYVLTGFPPQTFTADVHAGIFVGWIHKVAALIAERRYGQGKIVISTFQFTPELLDTHPMARTLLVGLVALTESRGS